MPPEEKPINLMKKLRVRITLLEELLGTASANPNIHREFIASKAPDAQSTEEEVASIGVEAFIDKSMTVFPRTTEGQPHLWDYQIKGFFKDACSMLHRCPDTLSLTLKAYKKIIDGTVFVSPRRILLQNFAPGPVCVRPLRASTAQGERIALASSEVAAAGTVLEFVITLLDPANEKHVLEWLNYGEFRGLGQWRNSGKGRFSYQVLE